MKIAFATGNAGKLREASEILGDSFEILTPAALGLSSDIEETGSTLKENSLIKAQYIYSRTGADCFADDSGLEVEILCGRPGVYSARYAGVEHDFLANMDKLSLEMARREMEASLAREFGMDTVHATRRACFRTVVTLIVGGQVHYFEGRLDGRIGIERKGDGGFGYDPLFIPDLIPEALVSGLPEKFRPAPGPDGLVPNVLALTNAQLSDTDKNLISHRGKAVRAMAAWLKDYARG